MSRWKRIVATSLAGLLVVAGARRVWAEEDKPAESANKPAAAAAPEKSPTDGFDEKKLKRLDREFEVWIDEKNRTVVVGGQTCLERGVLEMFACLKGTKEHESVVAANAAAYIVHAALLAIGAETGTPVKFDPYQPATGTRVDIFVQWKDEDGKRQEVPAQHWVRDTKTKKAMTHSWVFAGSGFWEDTDTGKKHYMAEGGDFICVSNFPSAMLDLPIESSQSNAGLLFEAFTEHVPPRGTPVRLILKPHLKEKKAAKEPKQPADQEATEPSTRSAKQKPEKPKPAE